MTFFIRPTLIFLFLVLFAIRGQATHIVGGDLTYKFIDFNVDNSAVTFEFTLNLYRDTSPGSSRMPQDVTFEVYSLQPDGSWLSHSSRRADRNPLFEVPHIENPCREEPTYFVGVETTFYQTQLTLPVIETDYMVLVKKCCRNFSINNILIEEAESGDAGATYDVIITPEAQKLGNNSVVFNKYPPIFICAALPLREDVSGIDIDGDSLVYSLCNPLNSKKGSCRINCTPPFDPVTFLAPYTAENPMAGNPVVGIDSKTGKMFGTPELSGQYVVGMCIEEYRDGTLISTIRRDFQFNAIACGEELSAIIDAPSPPRIDSSYEVPREIYEIDVCGEVSSTINSASTGGTVIYTYNWEVSDLDGNVLVNRAGEDVDQIFASLPKLGKYSGSLILNNGLDCPDTAFFEVNTYPGLNADFDFEMDSCFLASIAFSDYSFTEAEDIVEWEWNFDGESNSSDRNTIYKFDYRGTKEVKLIVTDNNHCKDSLSLLIDYKPQLDQDIPYETEEQLICYGDSILFGDKYLKEKGQYLYRLNDPSTGCDTLEKQLVLDFYLEPVLDRETMTICAGDELEFYGQTISSAGNYRHDIKAKIANCDSLIYILDVEMHQEIIPEVAITSLFDCFPGMYVFSVNVNIPEDSLAVVSWDLGDGSAPQEGSDFRYEYETSGTYKLTLLMEDLNGCRKTEEQVLDYNPPFEKPTREEKDKPLCTGDSIFFANFWVKSSGTYKDILKHDGTDCDSIFRTWNIKIEPGAVEKYTDTLICPEQIISFMGNSYNEVGEEIIVEQAKMTGCDSVVHVLRVDHYAIPEINFEDNHLDIPELADTEFPVAFDTELQSVSWSPDQGLSCSDCPVPIINYATDIRYTVDVVSEDGCRNSQSVDIHFIEIPHFIPTAIHPRAPNEIDRYFIVQKPEYALKTDFYDLEIFDRWGGLQFSGKNLRINDVTGGFSAEDMAPGVYVYKIQIRQPDETLNFSGNFTIVP